MHTLILDFFLSINVRIIFLSFVVWKKYMFEICSFSLNNLVYISCSCYILYFLNQQKVIIEVQDIKNKRTLTLISHNIIHLKYIEIEKIIAYLLSFNTISQNWKENVNRTCSQGKIPLVVLCAMENRFYYNARSFLPFKFSTWKVFNIDLKYI